MIEWIAQHRSESGPLIGQHHPEWLKLEEQVRRPVIEHWLKSYEREKQVPPGLVTSDGLMIDGNHRLAAMRQLGQGMWCCVVAVYLGCWRATGRAVWVE
jgi:hypothetical protein